jgi:hypothetical protein
MMVFAKWVKNSILEKKSHIVTDPRIETLHKPEKMSVVIHEEAERACIWTQPVSCVNAVCRVRIAAAD